MNYTRLDELLTLEIDCYLATSNSSALIVVGDRAGVMAEALRAKQGVTCRPQRTRLWFGLPIHTAPYPLLVGSLLTERSTVLDQLSLFAWIEDNYLDQPRAEVWGLTPFGEQPAIFLRDCDLDRPVEVWLQTDQPASWARVSGLAVATAHHSGAPTPLTSDLAALAALAATLPPDAQPFAEMLAREIAAGKSLKAALRAQRRTADATLLHLADGWRVTAKAIADMAGLLVRLHSPGADDSGWARALQLAPPKRW
ncbi:MAG: hypothetical protein ACK4WM_05825 [Thermoflexales bacterium]